MLAQSSATTRLIAALCAVPFLVVLLLFEALPLGLVAGYSFFVEDSGPTLANYIEIISSGFQRHAFASSITLSVVTAAIGVVLCLPIAVILRGTPSALQRVVLTYSNLCANFTGFPVAFAFIIMFGLSGFFTLLMVKTGLISGFNIYSTGGLMLVFSYFQVPLGLLLVYPSLGSLTPEITEAAMLMGASPASFWRRIGLPILWPALLSTFILLFANSMGTYATAFALAGGNANLVTIRIGELVEGDVFAEPNLADALSILLVVVLAVPLVFQQVILKRRRTDE